MTTFAFDPMKYMTRDENEQSTVERCGMFSLSQKLTDACIGLRELHTTDTCFSHLCREWEIGRNASTPSHVLVVEQPRQSQPPTPSFSAYLWRGTSLLVSTGASPSYQTSDLAFSGCKSVQHSWLSTGHDKFHSNQGWVV